ncbi:MAG: hypothetical protein V4757_14105 [Pseudomonadota bacterium]
MKTTVLCAAALSFFAAGVQAQGIERVKMTDNDLTCKQIFGEIGQMDGVIARANQPVAVPAQQMAAAPTDSGQGAAIGAGVAGAVAQTAIANAAVRSGGFGGFGGFGGGLGGMFGGIAQQAMAAQAQQQSQQQQQQQAAAQAAAQQAQMQAQQNAMLGQQAQGRKEHLTGMFLSKGCKMSDVQ